MGKVIYLLEVLVLVVVVVAVLLAKPSMALVQELILGRAHLVLLRSPLFALEAVKPVAAPNGQIMEVAVEV
jgi:hypothetical protein